MQIIILSYEKYRNYQLMIRNTEYIPKNMFWVYCMGLNTKFTIWHMPSVLGRHVWWWSSCLTRKIKVFSIYDWMMRCPNIWHLFENLQTFESQPRQTLVVKTGSNSSTAKRSAIGVNVTGPERWPYKRMPSVTVGVAR